MTVKEIALSVGKDERTVRRWVLSLSDKMSVVKYKMSLSSPMKPADYTLEETCQIIEAGMGSAAAGVYRANTQAKAVQKPAITAESLRQARLAVKGKIIDVREARAFLGLPCEPRGFENLSPAAYAVEMKEKAKKEQKQIERSMPGLFG
jgi:hypothetical protein